MKWPEVKLGEIFDIARGGSPRPIDKFITDDPNGCNWIMIGDTVEGSKYIASTKKKIRPEGLKKSRMVHEGDFLLTNSMSFGHPYILKTSGCIHDGWLVLSPENGNVHSDFFYYLLGSNHVYREFKKRAAGAVVKNLNTTLVKGVKIPLPPLEEQKRIAGILDAADALRTKRRESIALLDDLLQSTFLDLFGDPVTNPMGWEVKTLGDISSHILNGTTPKGGKEVYTESGITFFRSQNVWRNRIDWDDIAYIDQETHQRMLKSSLKYRDILITKTGRFNTENSSLGRAAMFTGKDDSANINGHVYLVRLSENVVNEFVLFILTTDAYRGYIRRVCVGGIDKRQINKSHLEQFPIIAPPLDLQKRFAAIVESVEKQKARLRTQLTELDNLFTSLQQRAFRGEL